MQRNRIRRLLILFFYLCSIIVLDCYAQNTSYYFYRLNIDKGLSQSTVSSILLETDGMMWIGTNSGLNLFDRYEMKNFFYDEKLPFSLPANHIFFIAEDDAKGIWISTNKGLVKYRRSDNSFLPIVPGKSVITYSFCSRPEGIYFGGMNVLYKYALAHNKVECYPIKLDSLRNFEIDFILQRGEQELLLISRSWQVIKYNLKNHQYKNLHFPEEHRVISSAYVDNAGHLYVSPYKSGLYCYDKQGKLMFHLSSDNSKLTNNIILSIIEKGGKLWLATDGGGINVLDKKNLSLFFIKHIPGDISSLPVNSITCLYKDRQDNLFAGSVRGGLFGIKEVFIKTYGDVPLHNPYGLTEKAVISLYEDKSGFLWIGTDGGGVNRYDPLSDTFKHYTSIPYGKVVSITEYSDSELLISLYSDKTYLFNKKNGKCVPFEIVNPQITRKQCEEDFAELVFRLSDKRIYLLSSTAYIYDIPTKRFTQIKTNENPAFLQALSPIYADEQTAFFIKYKGNRLFEVDQKKDSLKTVLCIGKEEMIRAACRDEYGIFWIGTDCGLSYFDPQNNEYRRMETQLFNNVSTLLYDYKGRLWIGAQNMLFSYDIRKKKFISLGESDGFSLNELPFCYQASPRGNNIYLGGVNGLVRIDRRISWKDDVLPQIKLLDVAVDGNAKLEELDRKSPQLTVSWDYSSLIVKVLSIEKDLFRKKLFRYTIVGTNRQHIVTYNHTLLLQTLSPGEYDIEVSCNAKNGDWTIPKKVLHLIVTPPWYKSPAVLTDLFIIICGFIIWGMFVFVRRRDKKMRWTMVLHEQKVNEEKVQFLINVSHELRTPLTLAYAPLKRILDRKEWELPENHLQESLSNIYRQVHHMKDLINMVLDLNKASEIEDSLNKSIHSINQWIKTIADEFKTELNEKKIRIAFDLAQENPRVCFDSLKCSAVLSNLLMNALKFSQAGTCITLISKVTDNSVRVSVCDEGIGLVNVNVNKLFTRYYQGEHKEVGTGIGLSYAKMLIEKHGGSIGALENVPRGAIFYFEFPYEGKQCAESSSEGKDAATDSVISFPTFYKDDFSTKSYSVMVVEDNNELRDFIKQSLNELFKQVYTAPNGCLALTSITNWLPDIIVSDVMMPQMDGFELCQRIKSDIVTSHIPVILLTARGDTGSMNIGYKLGADAYLPKPFEEELLLTVIVNQLKNRERLKKKYRESGFNNLPIPLAANNLDEEFIFKLNNLINDNISLSSLNVKFLTEQMGMSRTPLFTKLKALTNMGINDYIKIIRIERATQLLATTTLNIAEVSDAVGLDSPKYFSTLFKQVKGITPTQFRESQ